jgi:metal-dependent amidase/aminoacylase/carboxypeptidase family protein
VLACFTGAATATGARLEYRWGKMRYAPLRTNLALTRLFSHNMEHLGRQVNPDNPAMSFGSSDMGNVSQLVPSIHPFVAIAASTITIHSREFAEAAASDEGIRGLLDGAKAMAMTVADLIAEPANLITVQDEFKGR